MYLKANSPHAAAAGKSVIGFNVINGREVEGDLALIQSKSAVDHRDMVGMFPDSGEKDVARATKAASDAFRAWSATPTSERCGLALRTAAILTAHREKLARIVTREIGMTSQEALEDVQMAVDACTFFSTQSHGLPGQPLPSGVTARRRPAGVCGILVTGTSPLAAPLRKILPAILTGNTVVWKPSDNAPTAAYLLLRALMEAGLPPGVVNTVNGKGRAGCGKHLLAGIDKGFFQAFSFVGSAALGKTVGEMCGRNLILPSLDLTGKGAMVVLPDADLDLAVRDALLAAFGQAGQRTFGLGNIILHEACASGFKQRFLDQLAAMTMGNPLTDPDVAYGPMINARAATHFREHWEAGRQGGATLLSGGDQWTEANRTDHVKGNISHGAYMQPCVWEGVTPDMGLFQHPVPGPTVNLSVARNVDEALTWSNLTVARMSSCLYSHDPAAIERFQAEAHSDMVAINLPGITAGSRFPFAGFGTHPGAHPVFQGFTRWQMCGEGTATPTPVASTLTTDWDSL